MKKCVPVMAETLNESLSLISDVANGDCDLIEWRIDCLVGKVKLELFKRAWENIRSLTEKPIIITLRTVTQGGKADLSPTEYNRAIRTIMDIPNVQLIDIELISCGGDAQVKMLTRMAQQKEIEIIISYHDMQYTTTARDIEMMLCRMKYLGANIPKVAYMANSKEDVENLKKGATNAYKTIGYLIAISMGELGQETRVNGDDFGSIITFTKPVGSGIVESLDLGQIQM